MAFSRLIDEEKAENKFDWKGFKQGKFGVHCDTEDKARMFLRECGEKGIRWFCSKENVADRFLYGFSERTCYFIPENEKGIIQRDVNYHDPHLKYSPPSTVREVKKIADYTNKEIFDELARRWEGRA